MKRILILSIILISLLLSSCAGGYRITEEQKLLNELKKWENFSGEGIIELSYMGMSLRKDFNFAKSVQDLRLDLIDGGIFGSAGPLLSLYVGEYFSLHSPGFPAFELLNASNIIPAGLLALFKPAEYFMQKYGAEIIKEKALERGDYKLSFNPKNYQLESLMDTSSNMGFVLEYDSRGRLDTMEIKTKMPMQAKLSFDQVDYGRAQIIPLPPKEVEMDLEGLLKEGGVLDLLKGLKP